MIPAFLAARENMKRRGNTDNHVGASIGDVSTFDDFIDDDEDDEVVLESKGSTPPPPPSPMEEAQAQIELERQRSQFAAAEAERQRKITQGEYQDRVSKAAPRQQQAYQSAQDYGTQQVGARGYDQGLVDQYKLMDLYGASVDNARQGVAEDNLNPMSAYNTKTMFNDAYDTSVNTYRGDLRRQMNEFAPEDFSYGKFQNSADDDILSTILGQARGDAMSQIDQAKARGQLNDVGYNRALGQMDNQGRMAMADLQDLGGGVLSNYRKELDSMRTNEMNKIGTMDFSNPMNFDGFKGRLDQTYNDLTGRMSGDIYRATQGQSFFDPSSIISGSGAIQGFYNPTNSAKTNRQGVANPLLDAFTSSTVDPNKTAVNGAF